MSHTQFGHTTFQDYATRDKVMRAIMILNNHQLLMKYALANDQVSLSGSAVLPSVA
jgi:hypothetical protein